MDIGEEVTEVTGEGEEFKLFLGLVTLWCPMVNTLSINDRIWTQEGWRVWLLMLFCFVFCGLLFF